MAVAAAVVATLLVLMLSGHQMSAAGGHHGAGCTHATEDGAGTPGAPLESTAPGATARDAHLAPSGCSEGCGALLLCTILLAAVLCVAVLAAGQARTGRPARIPWARVRLAVPTGSLVRTPDLVALGISRI